MTKRYNDPRVLVGDWFDKARLREFSYESSTNLKKYRLLSEKFDAPVVFDSIAKQYVEFGHRVALCALNVTVNDGKLDFMIGGKMDLKHMRYYTEPHEYCKIVGYTSLDVTEKNVFVITSPHCDKGYLKYDQDFLLALSSSLKNKPLYIRYDTPAHPGLRDLNYVYLSYNPVTHTRWRILPVQKPEITRLEEEGKPVPSNTDVVVNHCSTNRNLSVNTNKWHLGFQGNDCETELKTCLDVYNRELPNNIWKIKN